MEAGPPINKLENDTLRYIFSLNANMFVAEDALTTTRHTSQVCKYWRDSMLATPSLWAKLLDLNALSHYSSNDWGEELIRRSGCSPLWIKMDFWTVAGIENLTLAHIPTREFFESMRSLPLTFQRPAPYLQTFNVNFSECQYEWVLKRRIHLHFKAEAPMLRGYSTDVCNFSACSSWLQQLCYLEIQTNLLTLADILTALGSACNLEDLVIQPQRIVKNLNSTLPFPMIHLPKLRRLKLSPASYEVQRILLEHVVLPPLCGLEFIAPAIIYEDHIMELKDALTVDDLRKEKVGPWIKSVGKHARRFFKAHRPTFLSIEIHLPNVILIEDHKADQIDYSWPWTTPSFTFGISTAGPEIPSHVAALLLQQFRRPELASIKQLNLRVDYNDSYLALKPYMSDLFPCFQGVEILEAANDELRRLPGFDIRNTNVKDDRTSLDTNNIIFPLLKTVKLDESFNDADTLHNFIQHRQSIGKPIAVVDIAVTQTFKRSIPDLSSLETFTGLEVHTAVYSRNFQSILEEQNYVCGNGIPDKLKFSSK